MSNRASKMNHYNANLINHLVSGFGKVLSVIETNNTYDEILGEKIDRFEYKSIVNKAGMVSSGNAIKFLTEKVSEISVHILLQPHYLPKNGFITFASTANNLREIEFLENLVSKNEKSIKRINISEWISSQSKVKVKDDFNLFHERINMFFQELHQGSIEKYHTYKYQHHVSKMPDNFIFNFMSVPTQS